MLYAEGAAYVMPQEQVFLDESQVEAAKKQLEADAASNARPQKAAPVVKEKLVVDDSQPSTEYIVKDGDSLSAIAKAHYHDGAAWEIIFDANKELLNGKPNFLKPKMKLVIPAVKKVPVSSK